MQQQVKNESEVLLDMTRRYNIAIEIGISRITAMKEILGMSDDDIISNIANMQREKDMAELAAQKHQDCDENNQKSQQSE